MNINRAQAHNLWRALEAECGAEEAAAKFLKPMFTKAG
jgi:hypothetical protein